MYDNDNVPRTSDAKRGMITTIHAAARPKLHMDKTTATLASYITGNVFHVDGGQHRFAF